jgi:hypothetical protein
MYNCVKNSLSSGDGNPIMAISKQRRARKTEKAQRTMPKILENTPPGYHWGWYSREEPRMHLQTVDDKHEGLYKVWLEERGRRIFEPATRIDKRVLTILRRAVNERRQNIEGRWVRFMIKKGWLQVFLSAPKATLVAYPNTPNSFARVIDLSEDILPEEAQALKPEDIALSPDMGSLQIWPNLAEDLRQDVRLSSILWQD